MARQFARAGGIAFVKRCGALVHGRHPVTVDALRLLSHLARYSSEWYPGECSYSPLYLSCSSHQQGSFVFSTFVTLLYSLFTSFVCLLSDLAAARFDVELGALLDGARAISGGGSSAASDSLASVVCNVIGNMCRHANTLHPMLLRATDGGGSGGGGVPSAPALFARVVGLVGSDEARVRRAACIALGNAAFHYRAEQVRVAISRFVSLAALSLSRARSPSPLRYHFCAWFILFLLLEF